MIIKRAIESIRARDWPALVSELLIVIVGILIAIQADAWLQDRSDRRIGQAYAERLSRNVENDIQAIEYSIRLATFRKNLSDLLMSVAETPEVARQNPARFLIAVSQAAYTYTPSLNSDTFEELKSTGNLRLLRSEALKTELFEYYQFDQGQRQYMSLQLMQEFRHFELGAGVLGNPLSIWVQDNMRIVSPDETPDWDITEVDLDDVVAAARRLSRNREFIDWLPEARGMQLELIATHSRRLEHAKALHAVIQSAD